jgi:hypothetical protein
MQLQSGQTGFADALVTLIGAQLTSVTKLGEESISLLFGNGAIFSVARDGTGPEVWQYNSPGGPIVVEQNT